MSASLGGAEVHLPPEQPCQEACYHPTEMSKRIHSAEAAELLNCANGLQSQPERKGTPSGQLHPCKLPIKTQQKPKPCTWEFQSIEGNHTGDAATGADTGNGGVRLDYYVQQISSDCR